MSGDLMGHDWAEIASADEPVISYVCQNCGHVEPKDLVICRPGEAKYFVPRFGADNVRESPYAPLGPGEAFAIDGRIACTTFCAKPKLPVFAYRSGW